MFKPLLIGGALIGVLSTPTLQAEEAAAASTPAPQSSQIPTSVAEPNASAPQLPDWVKERRAQLGISSEEQAATTPPMGALPPAPPEIPAWVMEERAQLDAPGARQRPEMPPMAERPAPPEAPAWVTEQRASTAAPTPPQRPEMPPMAERPASPDVPAWVEERRKRFAAPQAPQPPVMRGPAQWTMAPPPPPSFRPWGGAPFGGWGQPYPHGYNGWRPWMGNGWDNAGWNRGQVQGHPGQGPCNPAVEAAPRPEQSTEPEGRAGG